MIRESQKTGMTRRKWIASGVAGGAALLGGAGLLRALWRFGDDSPVAILRAPNYSVPLEKVVEQGLLELGIDNRVVKGKSVLLKPNLVEVDRSAPHVNTHPLLVRAVADTFRKLGASRIVIAEGSGHCLDSILVFESSGLRDALAGGGYRFVDLNFETPVIVPNRTGFSKLPFLALPELVRNVDWVVSMPKMKTHHWAGVTLSMKNLFGVMPGCYYGWPKNVLHQAGLDQSVADIAMTVRPQLAIVDGIIGMEGDGPIMGDPVAAGVIVMGADLPAVDATCARLMMVDPDKVPHLELAAKSGFAVAENRIRQVGESILSTRKPFQLLPRIEAHRNLRLLG